MQITPFKLFLLKLPLSSISHERCGNKGLSLVQMSSMKKRRCGIQHAYSALKGAVRAISRAAAADFGQFGVGVNTIFPGIIETPMTKGLESSQDVVAALVKMTPLARLGHPEDVSNAVLFLASDEAAYITGAELVIDGGYSAR
jgi:NAD(P)-dependent dehydrogenase (short-subunit alcohol dehydrogenase family)